MTIPTWVAAGTEAAGTGDVTPDLPTGWAENDIFLLLVETAQEFVAEPTDYDVVADSPQGGGVAAGTNSTRLDMFWKRATSSESAPTITDPGNHAIAQIHAFRGCVTTGEPWDVTSGLFTGTAATAHTIPGDTTTVADCLVVLAGTSATDATTPRFSAWANADLANINERGDVSTDVGNGGGLGLATGEKATAGAYGTTSFTLATSSFSGKMTVALKPATAGADATATPGVIAVTASLPAMSASLGATVSPASVSLVAGLPSATASADSTVSPAVIAATTGIPAAVLSAGATLTPGSIAVVVSMPEVTIESGSPATVTPATISLITALPAASITADSTIAPSPIALIVSFPASRVVIPVFRYLFTPPTHEVVAWETGRDDKNRRADPTWRHYDRGDRGKTVVRTNGQYATYTNPLYTVLEDADDIRLIDGTIGKAVFLGGHITEVTAGIKAELEAAGYTVEQEEVPQ